MHILKKCYGYILNIYIYIYIYIYKLYKYIHVNIFKIDTVSVCLYMHNKYAQYTRILYKQIFILDAINHD